MPLLARLRDNTFKQVCVCRGNHETHLQQTVYGTMQLEKLGLLT